MRVLIVEDEADLARALSRALVEEGFACDRAGDGDVAWYKATTWTYDVILLDLMLPRRSGMDILRALRAAGNRTPVLVLTARDALPDRVGGLDAGADDYLTKPFALEELVARIRALIRRSEGEASPVLDLGAVRVELPARRATLDGEEVPLTPKEFALLELLALKRGKLVTRTEIYDHLYDETDPTFSNVLDVYVANLRRKLGRELILTRRGEGYMIP